MKKSIAVTIVLIIIIALIGIYSYQNRSEVNPFERCDLNRDADCDYKDYKIAVQFVGNCVGEDNYRIFADENADGCVTNEDIKKLFPDNAFPTVGDFSIVLDKVTYNNGEIIKAKPNPNRKIYFDDFCGFYQGWKLFTKNDSGEWIAIDNWMSGSIYSCIPDCENNTTYFSGCDGLCVSSAFECQRLETDPLFEWNIKLYGPPGEGQEEGKCGNQQGTFSYVNPAPPGEYKLQFEYFEDSKCKTPKFTEKIFTIKE